MRIVAFSLALLLPLLACSVASAQEQTADDGGDTTLPLVVAVVGGVAIATGGVFALLSSGSYDDAESATGHEEAVAARDDGRAHAARANWMFVAGASLATIGLVWAAVEAGAPDEAAASVAVGPGSVLVRGRF